MVKIRMILSSLVIQRQPTKPSTSNTHQNLCTIIRSYNANNCMERTFFFICDKLFPDTDSTYIFMPRLLLPRLSYWLSWIASVGLTIQNKILCYRPRPAMASKDKDPENIDEDEDATEEEFTVEKVVDSRIRNGRKEYLLRWKGYPE